MENLRNFVKQYNEANFPNYKLVVKNNIYSVTGKKLIQVDLQDLKNSNCFDIKIVFRFVEELIDDTDNSIKIAERNIIEAFRKIIIE